MRLLITGASGYLGRRVALRAAGEHEVLAGYGRHREQGVAGEPVTLNLRRPRRSAATLHRLRPEAVIHAAAINPGGPEDLMAAVNVDGARHLAAAAAEIGAHWIQVSTDVVLSGYLNVAGSQVLSREQFGRRMLDWWRSENRELVASARAREVAPRVPRDLRLRLDRAQGSPVSTPGGGRGAGGQSQAVTSTSAQSEQIRRIRCGSSLASASSVKRWISP